jgi:hypothetical protein
MLHDGIAAGLKPTVSPVDAVDAAVLETALVALARTGELVSGRGPFDPAVHPSRKDVQFTMQDGVLTGCTIRIINSKAKGAERFRKLPVHLPITGKLLFPGLALCGTFVMSPTPCRRLRRPRRRSSAIPARASSSQSPMCVRGSARS